MIITNETGTFEVWSVEAVDTSSDLVVGSKDRVTLEQMLDSLMLAGPSDDHARPKEYFTLLCDSIKPQVLPSGALGYVVVIDRASVCLWLNFEVLNFLLYNYAGYKRTYVTE